ncbi:phosphate signaling complex PhoU family protein [Haloarcula halophila]|uniref:phosphate signaling complex PhoU family protein n=1 Tax=Haloarcula TaxID=2237 RepID=UPI0023E395DA|nr:phosphate uptake regulator PhoU [Halomicroarcula sp. DFY41]
METRKIQQVGGGTYTVSLPKEWAEQAEVSAGTVVDLHTHIDGLLVVQAGDCDRGVTSPIEIQVPPEDADAVEQSLRAAYAAGAESIRLTAPEGFTDSQRRAIDRVARNLTGVAVAEESATEVTVRTMLDATEVSITQSVRQLQFVALSMHRDAVAALTGAGGVDQPADRDDQADRLYAMIERHFERGLAKLDEVDALGLTRPELFQLWATARELERVADHAERIACVAARLESPVAGDLADDIDGIAATAQRTVEEAVRVVIDDAGVDTAHQALSDRDRVRTDVADLDRRLFEAPESDYRLTHVVDSLQRTAEHGGNVAELGLRSALREDSLAPAAEPADAND